MRASLGFSYRSVAEKLEGSDDQAPRCVGLGDAMGGGSNQDARSGGSLTVVASWGHMSATICWS
jgi:hypothetical protein